MTLSVGRVKQQNECADAEKSLIAAVSMGVSDKDVFYQLGACQYKNKAYGPSIESLSRAINAGINSKEVFLFKGNAEFAQKDNANASKSFKRLMYCSTTSRRAPGRAPLIASHT